MATIALCMIAKNEERFIKNAIDSVKPIADEIIVVDTGSQDTTQAIAKQSGAVVYDFQWQNDFSKAKNFALSKAKSEWILFLDADECISKQDISDIRKVIEGLKTQQKEREEIVAFSFVSRHYTMQENTTQDNANNTNNPRYAGWHRLTKEEKEQLTEEFPIFDAFDGYYDVNYITRLFKSHKCIYFTGEVHEQVDVSIQKWGNEEPNQLKTIVQCPIPIHHLHFLKKQDYVKEKQQIYFELSKEKIKQGPDAKISLDLAVGYLIFENNKDKSFACLKDAVLAQDNEKDNSNNNKRKMQIVDELFAKNRKLRALYILMAMIDINKHDKNSLFNLAKAYYLIKAYRAAIIVLKRMFDAAPHELLVIEYLGVCYDNIRYTDDAIRVFEHGIIVQPKNPVFYFNLGALYEKVKKWDKAIAAFERAIAYGHQLKSQLPKRIEFLKGVKESQNIQYNINIGDVK